MQKQFTKVPDPSKTRKLSVAQLVKERKSLQPELLKAYPQMPQIPEKITSFEDYAYALHDQSTYLSQKVEEIKEQFDNHFLTKKVKELAQENKDLKVKVQNYEKEFASQGDKQQDKDQIKKQSDVIIKSKDTIRVLKAQLIQAQQQRDQANLDQRHTSYALEQDLINRNNIAHKQLEHRYRKYIDQEQEKVIKLADRLHRAEEEKNTLNTQINQLLQKHRSLVSNMRTDDMEYQLQNLNAEVRVLKETNNSLLENNQILQKKVDEYNLDQMKRDTLSTPTKKLLGNNEDFLEGIDQSPQHKKTYLLEQLEQIKDKFYEKLINLKAKATRQPVKRVAEQQKQSNGNMLQGFSQFQVPMDAPAADLIKKEIDHIFCFTQLLDTILLQDDENKRWLEQLTKLAKMDCTSKGAMDIDKVISAVKNKFQGLLDENQRLETEKQLKYLPRIDSLIQENERLRKGDKIKEMRGVILENDWLKDQVNELKTLQKSMSTMTLQEQKHLEQKLSQLEVDKEEILQKAINLAQHLKTIKQDLELKLTQNAKLQDKIESMSRDQLAQVQQTPAMLKEQYATPNASLFDMKTPERIVRDSNYYKNMSTTAGTRKTEIKDRDNKLSQLIGDYRAENDRTVKQIADLRYKLTSSNSASSTKKRGKSAHHHRVNQSPKRQRNNQSPNRHTSGDCQGHSAVNNSHYRLSNKAYHPLQD